MDDRQQEYCKEVMRFRKVLNLTSVHDQQAFYRTFIQPSIGLTQWIEKGDIILDIGSGMGVPGIPILIDRSDVTGILVERRKKRAEFIRHIVRKLHLNCDVYDADIFDLKPLQATVCVARAVASIEVLLKMCDKHIVWGGKAVLPVPNDSIFPQVDGWRLVGNPTHKNEQTIVCYRKEKGCFT